ARVAAEARKVLSGPATIVVEGRELALGAALLGGLLDVAADGKRLRLDLPAQDLHDALRPQLAGLEVDARDARFVVEKPPAPAPPDPAVPPPADPTAAPVVAPVTPPPPVIRIEESVTGKELDVAAVAEALLLGEHRVEATLGEVAPRVDTERARTLRIVEPVSTFTTQHPAGQPRVKNIHRIADLVQGTVILPGERFSLNQRVGRRTRAAGFVEAPVIYDGEFTEDIGGGVSQFATTFFNAAFFGGYDIVSHQPHSYYISRYPMGREATVSYPQPDLVIANDSTSGILVQTSYTASSITVTLWGDKEGRTVEAEGPRVSRRSGRGFSVVVHRVIRRPGRPPQRERFDTFYRYQ
ncbi:MAG: VanW family protein, partial [Acidimicrobiia bacterium]